MSHSNKVVKYRVGPLEQVITSFVDKTVPLKWLVRVTLRDLYIIRLYDYLDYSLFTVESAIFFHLKSLNLWISKTLNII